VVTCVLCQLHNRVIFLSCVIFPTDAVQTKLGCAMALLWTVSKERETSLRKISDWTYIQMNV